MKTIKASVLLLACLATASCDQQSSDDLVLSYFAAHRPALERIVGLFAQNPELSHVAVDDPSPADQAAVLPAALEIRAQLEPLNLDLVARDLASGGILFVLREAGLAVSGVGKGLLYAEQLPPRYGGKLVYDIDLAAKKMEPKRYVAVWPSFVVRRALATG